MSLEGEKANLDAVGANHVFAFVKFWEIFALFVKFGLGIFVLVTGIWDGFVPWTGISWATGHRYCIHCLLEGVPAMRPLDVP